jgi:precorrin-3B C17-methyltransferase
MEIIREVRGNVAIGVVRNATRDNEEVFISNPDELIKNPGIVDMHTILFVASTETRLLAGKMVTPRGYSKKYSLKVER